jgi:hypothetical protein
MLLKNADSKERDIEELERLSKVAPAALKSKIEQELRSLRAGIKGEKESAYLIDFDFKEAERIVVIHDLRLEINGRVAQIDHLLIHRTLNCFVLETKHFHAGIQITEDGEFKQWNDFKKTYEGMASPLAQNERHIAVLKDAFERIELPTRAGIKLTPTFHSYVLVSPKARIDRPKKFDTSHIIKSDVLLKTIQGQFEKSGVLDVFTNVARIVSLDTIKDIGQRLVALHKPATFDYASKFGLQNAEVKEVAPPVSIVATPEPPIYSPVSDKNEGKLVCRNCNSHKLAIMYGKFGYYFKCGDCEGNTPIKIACGNLDHNERIRKDGKKFFRECAECGSSSLYFVNP